MNPFESKNEITKKEILCSMIENYLTTQSSPDMWDIEAWPVVQKMNSMGEHHIKEAELLCLYVDIKNSLMRVTEPEKKVSIAEVKNNELVFLKSSEIKSKPIDWLWQDKIAKGKVTLIAGDPGLGKSQTTIFLAGVVSNGGVFPGGSACVKGKVLFFSAEDDPEDTINPRLQAVGADRENIFIFSVVKKDGKEKFFDLSKDIDLLKKTIEEAKDVSLIIVDPITAFLGETDSHVNAEVRALLSMLSKLASQYGIAVVVVTHLNKSTGGSPLNKITGSLAFVAAARAAYMVIKDESDENRRLFLPVKNNLAEDKGGFAFRVEGVTIDENIFTSKVVWETESISMSLIEAMKEVKGSRGTGGVELKVIEKLEAILKKYPDGLMTNDFIREAGKIGISKRMIYKAKQDMYVDVVASGKGHEKIWKYLFTDDSFEEDDKF